MNIKAAKRMKGLGLTCHSPASTAVCMNQVYRSVIEPQRRTEPQRPDGIRLDQERLINKTKYIRLGEQRAVAASPRRSSIPASSLRTNREKDQPREASNSVGVPDQEFFQVVVMRVSIHCQGCARKVKKHLSKMEGVTSFSIELESKRVTVMGHVSASGVLESISRVKKAEFWPH